MIVIFQYYSYRYSCYYYYYDHFFRSCSFLSILLPLVFLLTSV